VNNLLWIDSVDIPVMLFHPLLFRTFEMIFILGGKIAICNDFYCVNVFSVFIIFIYAANRGLHTVTAVLYCIQSII